MNTQTLANIYLKKLFEKVKDKDCWNKLNPFKKKV